MAKKSIIMLSLSAMVSSLDQNVVADDTSHLGCVWDGESGCHDGCDPISMEARCQRLSHDQAACEGEEGQDDWCVWSHGDKIAVQADEVEMEAMYSSSRKSKSGSSSRDRSSKSVNQEGCCYGMTPREDEFCGWIHTWMRDDGEWACNKVGCEWMDDPSGCDGSYVRKKRSESSFKSVNQEGCCYGTTQREDHFCALIQTWKDGEWACNKAGCEWMDDPSGCDGSYVIGCVWDGTGCHGDCDTKTMEDRCNKYSHDKDLCEGDVGQYNRCIWSHGGNTAVQADEVQMEVMMSHDSREMKQEEIPQRLGCIWDQTGCSNGCDMEAMDARCDRMSHDQEMCEGEVGAFNRCTWSHGASGAQMNVDIRFADIGEDWRLDVLLIVAGVITTLFIIHQLYRWIARNREYKKLQGTQHNDEIQITSHAV